MKNRFFVLMVIGIILAALAFSEEMSDTERKKLLKESTDFANDLNKGMDVKKLQESVEIPQIDQKEQKKLESYKNNSQKINGDGSQALSNSEAKKFFIKERSDYKFTENDPLFKTADNTRENKDTKCTSQSTVKEGIESEKKSQIQTCEVYKMRDIKYCNVANATKYKCDVSLDKTYDRNGSDKASLKVQCDGENKLSVTVDAWGQKGKCNGPVTVSLDLTEKPITEWNNLTTLQPHWGGGCKDLPVYYKGGCTTTCPNGKCTESCKFNFLFSNDYLSQEEKIEFSRLSFTEDNQCTWYEKCESGGDCGKYERGEFLTESCTDSVCRMINGQKVCPDCWNWKREYAMFYTKNNCQDFIKKGCGQIGSKCITKDENNVCTLLENTFDCSSTVKDKVITDTSSTYSCKQDIPCMGESCFEIKSQASPDFKQSVTYLSVADEMSQDMDKKGGSVFSGQKSQCSKYMLNEKSCCGSDKGFLFGCNADEKKLADARNKGTAHLVGSYCESKGAFGLCLEKRETYCVFNSVLARVIQEQGRAQIGKSWGTPENSSCSAFSLKEIESIDFEKIDFSDFIAGLEYNKKPDLKYDPNKFKENKK